MSLFNTRSSLSHTRYKAAGKPFLGNTWLVAVVDFINTRFTAETTMNVDTITESTTDNGVTIESVNIKDGMLTSALTATSGFPLWNGVDPSDWILFIDDFITPAVDDIANGSTGWAVATDAIGSTGAADALGGWFDICTDNTDNNATTLSSASEAFKFDTDKKLIFKCRISLTEANTDDANWAIGLADLATVDLMQDNGAGPAASYDGAIFWKIDGTMQIGFETSNAGSQVTTANLGTFASGTTYNLAFVYDYNDGTTALVTPYLDGVAGTAHSLTISGLEEMHIVISVKAGDTNAETLKVDYVAVAQERR